MLPSGTTFPGSPVANDTYYRTDLGLLCYYDGTRWLTIQIFEASTFPPADLSVSSSFGRYPPHGTTYNLWIVDARITYTVPSNHDGSNFWTIDFRKFDNSIVVSFATIVTDKATTTWNNPNATAVGALLDTANKLTFIEATKTGTPGNLGLGTTWRYRLVVT